MSKEAKHERLVVEDIPEEHIVFRNEYLFIVAQSIGGMTYRYLICTDKLESPDDIITGVDTLEEASLVVDALMIWDMKRIVHWNLCSEHNNQNTPNQVSHI